MKKGAFIILTTLFFTFSCNNEPLNDNFELNQLQTFIPGIIYHLENTETTFRIIDVNDSRCPKGVECLWEGMVQIDLVFQSQTTDTLKLNTYNNSSDTIENYVFQLMEVEPSPEMDKEINLDDYRLTMNIFKN